MFSVNQSVSGKFHGRKFAGVVTESAPSTRDASVTRIFVTFDSPVKVSGHVTSGISLAIPASGVIADRMFASDYIASA